MQCKGLPDLLPLPGSQVTHTAGVCVCVCICVHKILALAQDKVIWYCTAPTSMNNSEEQERGEMWQASAAGKERKRDWERHRWRQSEICQEFEFWDCRNAINVWRGFKSFWFETRTHCYAWLLMHCSQIVMENKYCTHLDHPHILQGEQNNQNSFTF